MAGIRNTHQRWRKHWNAIIRLHNGWPCRRCGITIPPGQPYHLGHPTDATPGGPTNDHDLQPEHPTCNTSAGATAGNIIRAGRIPPSRNW